ncbi:MAG: glycosyltransferase [Cyanobacteriota bacterium]|nr:glycosyltransferase [Cyanobacteriota bacterium]
MTTDHESCVPRVALVHDYLIKQGGSENVVQALHALFPEAPLYSSLYARELMPPEWQALSIHTSFLQAWAERGGIFRVDYQSRLKFLLPFMPLAYESFNFTGYDCVISSCHAYAKGILTGCETLHISYLHSPTRYLWQASETYSQQGLRQRWQQPLSQWLLHRLRQWDLLAAQRPDYLIANSHYIRRQIEKFYRRSATVIYPPVDVEFFQPVDHPSQDYDLVACRLVPYKRVDIAIQAYNHLQRRLVVVGEGPELPRLQEMAGSTIEFLPHQSRSALRGLFAHCRAFVFPWAEDFGITPVEVQACGRPVIALNQGGAKETIVPGQTGILFNQPTPEGLAQAILAFDQQAWDPQVIRRQAESFSHKRFVVETEQFVQQAWQNFRQASSFPKAATKTHPAS